VIRGRWFLPTALAVLLSATLRPQSHGGAGLQVEVLDTDGDGVADSSDDCPLLPETRNGFADGDGCPDTIDDLLRLATIDLDLFWLGRFERQGRRYLPPNRVKAYVGGEATGCGTADMSSSNWSRNARYCVADHSIYLDHAWMDEEMITGGDFAPVTILAHEWGHLVQELEGLREEYTIEAELQADCLSGAFAKDAEDRGALEPGDLQEGLDAAFRSGSYDVPWNEPGSHGTPPQRLAAFFLGYQGAVEACGDVRSGDLGSIIGIPPEERPSGSLADQIVPVVGDYLLIETAALPELLAGGAIDAVHAVYRDSRGVEVALQIAAYASEERCASELERLRDAIVGLGYVQIEESIVTDPDGNEVGTRYRLSAADEIIVWSAGTALAGLQAPGFDQAMEFVDDFLTASPS
jgi:predicted metalloprotease